MAKQEVNELARLFREIDGSFDALFAKANKQQRKKLRENYSGARLAMLQALNRHFDSTDHLVKELKKDLAQQRKSLATSLRDMKDVVAIINFMTAAVKTASSLAGLVL